MWPTRGTAGGTDGWVREDSREPGLLAADGSGRLHRSIHHLVSRARQVEGRLLLILASGGEIERRRRCGTAAFRGWG